MTTPDPGTLAGISANYGRLPLGFEPNEGQADSQAGYLARGPGYAPSLAPNEAVLRLQTQGAPTGEELTMQLVGASAAPNLVGLDLLAGTTNYLTGNNPSQWHTSVPNFARVQEQGVYPGVDLVYYGTQQQLEYDFTVAPGVGAGVIRLAFQGADSTTLDAQGNLVLHTAIGSWWSTRPCFIRCRAASGRKSRAITCSRGMARSASRWGPTTRAGRWSSIRR